jgi:hypothetical protein
MPSAEAAKEGLERADWPLVSLRPAASVVFSDHLVKAQLRTQDFAAKQA